MFMYCCSKQGNKIDILVQTLWQLQVMCYIKLLRLYSGKEKTRIVQYLNYGNCFIEHMGSGSNWYQIVNKTCYILIVSKFYIEKRYLC